MSSSDQELLKKFVACFSEDGGNPLDEGVLVVTQTTDRSALDPVYAKIPERFPDLFEELLLTYRWHGADTGTFRIYPNPPGADLSAFLSNMLRDDAIFEACVKSGFVPFGKGSDLRYDPVCFDMNKGTHGRRFSIVKLDHEQILCNSRVKVVEHLAKDFGALVRSVVESMKDHQR